MARRFTQKVKQPTQEEKEKRLSSLYPIPAAQITIGEAFTIFFTEKLAYRVTNPTIEAYKRMMKKYDSFLLSFAGKDKDATPVDFLVLAGTTAMFIHSLGKVSQQTINHYLRHYRAFGNFCEDKGFIAGFSCPIKEVEAPIKHVYTDAELKKLLAKPNKDNFIEYRNYCIVKLILETGARSQTIRFLKVEDVDLADGYINFNTTKAHKVIRLGLGKPIIKDLCEYIARYRTNIGGEEIPKDAPLFPSDKLNADDSEKELSRNALIKTIAAYNKKRGVEKTSLHLMRHTFAKNWITSGGDIITLAKVLTHSELTMVQKYANLYADDVKEEMQQHSTLSLLDLPSGKTIRGKSK